MPYRIVAALAVAMLMLFFDPANATDAEAVELSIDACALLREAEIEDVVGQSVGAAERSDSGHEPNGAYSSTCLWPIGRDDASPAAPRRQFVILNAMRWPAASGLAVTFLEAFRDAAARGELPAQPEARDFGDEALWWGDGLAVRKGDVSFGISVIVADARANAPGAIEEKLVPRILQRLDEGEVRGGPR
jgi:hypothetical protein